MSTSRIPRSFIRIALLPFALMAAAAPLGSAKPPAPDLNPAAIFIKPPEQIHWSEEASGAMIATLVGDTTKEGLYVVLVRWRAHHMSHPHFHPNDRYITVISGTWWVGTGAKFDPDSTVPVKAGSFVIHYGKQIHYDGAKDEDAYLEIVGQGPSTATPAETK